MDYPAYAVVNKGASASVTASSEDSVYVLENLVDGIMGKPAVANSGSSWWIEFDLGGATQLNGWAILGHNFGIGMTAVLKAGSGTNPAATIATFTYRSGSMFAGFTAASHRFWRLTITDSNAGDLQIGEMFPMLYAPFPRGIRFGGPQRRKERRQTVLTTIGGVKHVTHFYTRRTPEYPFRYLDSQLDEIEALDDLLIGQLNPFIFIPDTGSNNVLFARMQSSEFVPVELAEPAQEPISDYVFALAEESPGKRILA